MSLLLGGITGADAVENPNQSNGDRTEHNPAASTGSPPTSQHGPDTAVVAGPGPTPDEHVATGPVRVTDGRGAGRVRGGSAPDGRRPRAAPDGARRADLAAAGHGREDDNHPAAAAGGERGDAPPEGDGDAAGAAGGGHAGAQADAAAVDGHEQRRRRDVGGEDDGRRRRHADDRDERGGGRGGEEGGGGEAGGGQAEDRQGSDHAVRLRVGRLPNVSSAVAEGGKGKPRNVLFFTFSVYKSSSCRNSCT